jgi:hypothetical protein
MRRIDGTLSRRAQQMLDDGRCVVYSSRVGDVHEYVLERADHEPVILGQSGSAAYQSLVALRAQVRANRVRCGYCGSTDLGEDEQRQGMCRSCIPDAMEDARGDAICDERRGK